jgi:5-methylthioadenosine/S-adenosylhomocysteine deaminase
MSCSDDLWKWVSGFPGDPVRTTHCAESTDETRQAAISSAGGNVRFLHGRNFLGPETILAHCVHLSAGEASLLADSDTSVAHCPWTNLRLGSGIADTAELIASGVRVFPASDGAACNNRLDLPSDIRLGMSLMSLRRSPSAVSGRMWLRAATECAGHLLRTGHGRLHPGFDADIVLLEPGEQELEELESAEDPVRYILELDWPSRVRLVIVRGAVLFADGGFPTLPPLPMSIADARREVLSRARVSD